MPAKIPGNRPAGKTQDAQTAAARRSRKKTARTPPPGWQDPLAQQQPLVGGRWLAIALLSVVGFAIVCAYLTLCLLFYQGQWQVVFHPSRTITTTPAAAGLTYDAINFAYTGTGTPQLSGWWIPAAPGGADASRTLLFLHDGQGSLSDCVSQLKLLHSLGVNIFAFDYRGFGESANTHPSESRVYEDADAAWNYLTDIRHLEPHSILLYGVGLGATVASEAAIRHPQSPALVLEDPAPPALNLIAADSRTSIIPIRWLFRDRFEIVPRLNRLGIDLSQSTQAQLVSGKHADSFEVVRHENRNPAGPALLLFLGPTPSRDPRYLPALQDFLARQ